MKLCGGTSGLWNLLLHTSCTQKFGGNPSSLRAYCDGNQLQTESKTKTTFRHHLSALTLTTLATTNEGGNLFINSPCPCSPPEEFFQKKRRPLGKFMEAQSSYEFQIAVGHLAVDLTEYLDLIPPFFRRGERLENVSSGPTPSIPRAFARGHCRDE